MNGDQLIKLIDARIKAAGGVRPLAREWKVSAGYLSRLRNGNRQPGPKILHHLGLEEERAYRKV